MLSIEKCKELEAAGFGMTSASWVYCEQMDHSNIYYTLEDSPWYEHYPIQVISYPSMEEIIEKFQLVENAEWEMRIDGHIVGLIDKDDTYVSIIPKKEGLKSRVYMRKIITNNNYHEALADLWLLCKQHKII